MPRQAGRGLLPRSPARVSIFGMGYVGCVNAACFSAWGHHVTGVDVNPEKVEEIRQGGSPIVEPGLNRLIRGGIRSGLLAATTSAEEAIARSTISFICVGTPSRRSGQPSPEFIEKVSEEIGRALRKKKARHLVAIRSTSLPGTAARAASIIAKASGKKEGRDFSVSSHPEFLREGSAVADFRRPPFTIFGVREARDSRTLQRLYGRIPGEVVVTEVEVSEMIKYASNAYHAVKVTFANEIGALCRTAGVDSHQVMEIFARDTKLNISGAYLKPGFAFGGSCLPKDVRALNYLARSEHLDLPLLAATISSNEAQIQALVERIAALGKKKIGILGLAFKSGTDDLRESPMVRVVEWLIGKGYQVRIFDPNVQLSRLIGANRAFIEKEIPHIASLMAETPGEVVAGSEIVLVGNREEAYVEALGKLKPSQRVIETVRLLPPGAKRRGRWEGLYW